MEDYFKSLIDKLKHGDITSDEMIRCLENTDNSVSQPSNKQTLPTQMTTATYESAQNPKNPALKSPKLPSCTSIDALSPINKTTTLNNSKSNTQDLNTLRTEFEKLQKKLEGLGKIERTKKNPRVQSPENKGEYYLKTEVSSVKQAQPHPQYESYQTFSKPTEENKTLSTHEDVKNLKDLKAARDARKKRKSIEIPKCDISKIKHSENDEEGNESNREDIELLLDEVYKNDSLENIQNLYSKFGLSAPASKPTTGRKNLQTAQARPSEGVSKSMAKSNSVLNNTEKAQPRISNLMTLEYSPRNRDIKTTATARAERGSSSGKSDKKKEATNSQRELTGENETDMFDLKQKSFYQRQVEYEKIKLQHLVKVFKETQPTLKPTITQKSREIVEAKHIPDLMTKVEEVIKTSPKKTSVSPKKKSLVSSVISDDYYNKQVKSFLENKETKLEQMRKKKSDKEVEGFTGKPELNKKAGINSKIGIGLTTSAYIEQLKEKEQVKQHYKDLVDKRRDMKETIECTYQPQINPTPKYLKEKASHKEKENNPNTQSQIKSPLTSKNSYLAHSQSQARNKDLSQSRYKDIQPKKNHLRVSYSKSHRMDIPDLFSESVPARLQQEATEETPRDPNQPKAEDLEIENIYFSPSESKAMFSKVPPALNLQEVETVDSDAFRLKHNNSLDDNNKENNGEDNMNPLCLEDLSTKLSTVREKRYTDSNECRIKPLNLKAEIVAMSNDKLLSSPSFRGGDKSYFTLTSQRQDELRGCGFDTIVNI